jgi:hypothetical protein
MYHIHTLFPLSGAVLVFGPLSRPANRHHVSLWSEKPMLGLSHCYYCVNILTSFQHVRPLPSWVLCGPSVSGGHMGEFGLARTLKVDDRALPFSWGCVLKTSRVHVAPEPEAPAGGKGCDHHDRVCACPLWLQRNPGPL